MDGVVDGVQVQGLGALGQVGLAGGGAVLGLYPHLQVLLGGVGQDLAQQLGKLGGVLGFLKGGGLPVLADLGIALAIGHPAHGQVHTHLGTFAGEVVPQILDDILGSALGHANNVLSGPGHLAGLLDELAGGSLALGALLGGIVAFVDVTANAAYVFRHSIIPPYLPRGESYKIWVKRCCPSLSPYFTR